MVGPITKNFCRPKLKLWTPRPSKAAFTTFVIKTTGRFVIKTAKNNNDRPIRYKNG